MDDRMYCKFLNNGSGIEGWLGMVTVTPRILLKIDKVLREVLKGIVREVSAFFFKKSILENMKTTPCRRKQKGGSQPRLTN